MQAAITIKIVNSLISKYNKNLELRDGKQYASSRDFVAATGLVTRQYSTGGWTTLGGGNKKIRTLLVQCAEFLYKKLNQCAS